MISLNKIISSEKKYSFIYFFLFLLMLVSDDSFWFGTNDNNLFVQIKFMFLGLLPFLLLLNKKSKKIGYLDGAVVLALIVVLVFVSSLINSSKLINGSTVVCFLLVAGCLIVRRFPLNIFFHCFSNIIVLLSLYSIIIYLFVQMGLIHLTPVDNIGGSIVYAANGCAFLTPNGVLYRNAAIFREPGMFIIYVCLAFLFDVCTSRKLNIYRVVIYGLAIITSYSTAGFLLFGLILFLQFYNAGNLRKGMLFLIPIIAFVTFIYLYKDVYLDVFGKLIDGTDNGSTRSRWASTIIPLYIIPDYILFGCGLDEYVKLFDKLSMQIFHTDASGSPSSNTILSSMAIWGVWMGAFFIASIWSFSKKMSRNRFSTLLVFIIIVLLYSNEVRYLSIYTYIIAFYGLSKRHSTQIDNSKF